VKTNPLERTMKLSLATDYPHLKSAIKAVLRRSAFAALLLVPLSALFRHG
jgi:hypothetical protein